MSRICVLLSCFATCAILGQPANAQCLRYYSHFGPVYRVPGYQVRTYCAPPPAVYQYGYCRYVPAGYVYYSHPCCGVAKRSKVVESRKTAVQKPALAEAAPSVLETPRAQREPAVAAAPPAETTPATEPASTPPPLPSAAARDIRSTLEAEGRFSTLLKAAEAAELLPELNNPGPITVLAPTDAAFEKLDPAALKSLLASPDSLREVLRYHALAVGLLAADALSQGKTPTVLGPEITFQQQGDRVLVNDAQVVKSDVKCTNGVIHVIDGVLIPPGFQIPPPAAVDGATATAPPPAPTVAEPAVKAPVEQLPAAEQAPPPNP